MCEVKLSYLSKFWGAPLTFEARVKVPKASKWWRIDRVEVASVGPVNRQPAVRSENGSSKQKPSQQAQQAPASLTSFPLETEPAHDIPTVLFSSDGPVCLTIRELGTGRLMVMKNIAPTTQSETRLPIGEYSAHVVGKGFEFKKRFAVMRGTECVEINLSADAKD